MAMVMHCLFTCIVVFICFLFTNGELYNVDNSRSFSIQAAIDAVPSRNTKWVTISIKAGVYNEKVTIPSDKPFIHLKGEGIGKTTVVWDANETMLSSATFSSLADNIIVSGITFVNSHNYPPSRRGNPVGPALAARISGDKSAFYRCSFLGYQDTLLDDTGRHYFVNCTIEGAIDFIFGNGQSIYEKCIIRVNIGQRSPYINGFITAQARQNSSSSSGFVFKGCNVSGKGKAFLGRAWKAYSRVIFYRSFFSNMIVPQGWDIWFNAGHEKDVTFAEEKCLGPGSNKSNRVNWEKTLSQRELRFLTNISYIDNDGWISRQPRH